MKAARATDWKTEPIPARRATIPLDRSFSAEDMERIRLGLVPQQMEDKWFVYWSDDALYFHRSWTGACIYIVRFVAEGDSARIVDATVNREPDQYNATDDQRDVKLISYLIDVLLLHRNVSPPLSGGPGDRALETWSLVGRAMLGEHPDSDPAEGARPDH